MLDEETASGIIRGGFLFKWFGQSPLT